MINQMLKMFIFALAGLYSVISIAQPRVGIEQVQWKSESQVRALLGEPESIKGPIGTHASYMMWKYRDFTVAFANRRAFHMFNNNSLRKVQLIERPGD